MVILADAEGDAARALQNILAGNLQTLAINFLVKERSFETYRLTTDRNNQIAIVVNRDPVRALDLQRDGVSISTGGDDKVIFKLMMFAVIDHIDAGIHVRISHLTIRADSRVILSRIIPD